ncbi:MAG: YtxH domain-containing protein [Betaproteobacteria bacterium]
MGDGYDRFENEGAGGGSFVIGLLAGTVLGAGIGMLFAPKPGSELRNQISEQAGAIANTASDSYRRASDTVNDLADKGRHMYDRAREAVGRGGEEARRHLRDVTGGASSSSPTSGASTSGPSS